MLKLLLPLLLASGSSLAETPPAYGASDCRIGALLPAPTGGKVSWSGACKDGFADGPGLLAWNDADDGQRRIEGTLVRGSIAGEATLTWEVDAKNRFPDSARNSYIGTLRDGRPDGQGFFQYAHGDMYEGGVVNGKPHGAGIRIDADRARYEGQWVDGKRDGNGSATFALGGSYTGAWKNDVFEGAGTIVYAGTPRTWQGRFHDGRPEGVAAPATAAARPYYIARDHNATGARVPSVAVIDYLPPDAPWAQLSVEQQNFFKAFFPALAPGDEPPYPRNGTRATGKLISKIRDTFDLYHGLVRMRILVGADGQARSATAVGKVPEEIARFVSAAMMSQPYKAAVCQGTPCDMIYPVSFLLK